MAFRFCDSFDHYNTAQMGRKWTAPGGTITTGRHGNGVAGGFSDFITIDEQDTWIVGFAMNTQTLGTGGILRILSTGTEQIALNGLSDGRMRIVRGGGATLGTTAGNVYQVNEWHYYEVKVFIHTTLGTVELRVDGNQVISASGLNTNPAATGVANVINIQGAGGGASATFDDFYVNDGTGSVNNDFFGDVEIMAIFPDSDGSIHAWTPKGGSPGDLPQFDQIDETPQDDDASYIESDTPGQISIFGFPTLSFDGTVQGVQLNNVIQKTDVGIRTIKGLVRIGSTNYFGPEQYLSTDYLDFRAVYSVNPATLNQWDIAEVNAAFWGIEVFS